MTLASRVIEQFHRPHGLLGRVAGWVMATRASNLERNRWTVDLLDVRPGHDVAELGPGPGVTLGLLLSGVEDGRVVAVDHSALMLRQCRRHHRAAVADGRLTLVQAEFPGLPPGRQFDRIIAVNSLQFDGMSPDVMAALVEALKPGGKVAVTFQPRGPSASNEAAVAFGHRVEALLEGAGLTDVRLETLPLEGVCAICVLGTRGA